MKLSVKILRKCLELFYSLPEIHTASLSKDKKSLIASGALTSSGSNERILLKVFSRSESKPM